MYLLATDYATDFALSSPELNDLIANLRARVDLRMLDFHQKGYS